MKIIWSLLAAATLYAADTRPVIVCFGDSLTAGFGLDSGQSYPDLLQGELDRRGYKYRVENLSVSGVPTGRTSARFRCARPEAGDSRRRTGRERRLARAAGIGHRAEPGEVIEAFQKAKVRVLLAGITLPPNYGPDYIPRFAAIYPQLAAKYKVRLLDFLLAGVAGNPQLMQQDGLHPNAEGTHIVAATVLKSLQPML